MAHNKLILWGAAGLLIVALPASAQSAQTATITNSGSTNTTGYKISVTLTGSKYSVSAITDDGNTRNHDTGNRPARLAEVRRLFTDLDAAKPLPALPVRHGMRSVSFGTATTITYKGQTSPDLTFASDPRTAALKADMDAITKTMHIGNTPKRPIVIHSNR